MLSVENLSVSIGGAVVVDGVSLHVAPGECLALVGESGSGKTMIANALLGLSPGAVTADRLEIAGHDARGLRERQWRRLRGSEIALVSQDALVSLDPLRRVGAEVSESLDVHEPSLSRARSATVCFEASRTLRCRMPRHEPASTRTSSPGASANEP